MALKLFYVSAEDKDSSDDASLFVWANSADEAVKLWAQWAVQFAGFDEDEPTFDEDIDRYQMDSVFAVFEVPRSPAKKQPHALQWHANDGMQTSMTRLEARRAAERALNPGLTNEEQLK